MAIVRLEAMRALKQTLLDAIPELSEEHVYTGQAPPNAKLCFPALVIDPIRFRYLPDQALETAAEPDASRVVMNVGRHVATVQLRLAAATLFDRWKYQEAITNVFLGTPLHPGVLLTTVTACEELGSFLAAWEYDEDEWQDEKAFDTQFWAVMTLTGIIPALVTRAGAYRIEDLRLGLTGDMVTEFTSATFDSSPNVEVVRVNEDGTLTALP